jgi:hypothetical protein
LGSPSIPKELRGFAFSRRNHFGDEKQALLEFRMSDAPLASSL